VLLTQRCRECFKCASCGVNLFSVGGYREVNASPVCGNCANKQQGYIDKDRSTTRSDCAGARVSLILAEFPLQQAQRRNAVRAGRLSRVCACHARLTLAPGRFRKAGEFSYHFECFKYDHAPNPKFFFLSRNAHALCAPIGAQIAADHSPMMCST
jgi:hypothetical protein